MSIRKSTMTGFVAFLALLAVNLFWSDFVRHEKTLYAWDHVAYWSLTASLVEDLKEDPGMALANIGRSLAEDELNLLPSMPLTPSLALFGQSRRTWILTVLNCYAVPALLLGFWALWRIGGHRKNRWDRSVSGLIWIGTVLLFAPLWEPLALGYLDIGGLVLVFAAIGLMVGTIPEKGKEARLRDVAVGVAVAVLMIFRRWYTFWSLSFCLVVGLGGLWALVRARKTGITPAAALRTPLSIGAGVLGTLVLFVGPRLMTIAGTDYGDRFIHYKTHPTIWAEIIGVVRHFGLMPLGLAFAGTLLLLRSPKTRMIAVGLAVQLALIAVLFRRVQDPTPQHWYLLLPGFMLLTAGGLTAWVTSVGAAVRRVGVTAVLVLGSVVTSQVFGLVEVLPTPLVPAVSIAPKTRGDLPEFGRLMEWLDGRLEMGSQWIYVLAATGAVSDSSLGFTNFSLNTSFRSPAHVLMTAQVDRRDGFPDGLLVADLVIVPLPVAVGGGGETQRVVEVPVRLFLEGDGLAKAFVRVGEEFHFDDGVVTAVFERYRPNTAGEIEDLSDRLRAYYPDRTEIWMPPA